MTSGAFSKQFLLGRPNEGARDNNLALVRFVAAGAVLFAHSWPISSGAAALDPGTLTLQRWFGDDIAIASLAVHAFFVISGYLVTGSALAQGSVAGFAAARILRIYPALVLNIVVCAVLMGALITTLPTGAYFASGQFWKFLVNNVFSWNVIYALPGVFESNPLHAVNGSLWTLPLEIRCYVATALLLGLGALKRGWIFSLLALALIVGDGLFRKSGFLGADAAANCFAYFLIGAVLYVNRRIAPPSPVVALVLLGASMGIGDSAIARLTGMLGWSLLVLWFAVSAPRTPWPEKLIGDPSYGIYIYAFPIQQLVVLWLGPGMPWRLATIAGAATILAGILSWKALEAPVLARKGAVARAWTNALHRPTRLATH